MDVCCRQFVVFKDALHATTVQILCYIPFRSHQNSVPGKSRQGIANPIGTIWSATMMLEHLGESVAAARLMAAVEKVMASGCATPDPGRQGTSDVTKAVINAL